MCEGGKGERCACVKVGGRKMCSVRVERERCACVKVGGRKMCMCKGGNGDRCECVRVGTETDVNVEVADLPHLTNHSDTLVGVQIDN